MTAPNLATLWGETIVDELAASGLDAVCVAPGSRSTPLTVAFADHPDVRVFSHLDERSAAFFALGRSRKTGEPTALVCTSGTAAANFHPAVIEADRSRVPLVVLTADRPAELRDSGANQTVDQTKLYGDAVRSYRCLPEPAAEDRRLRSLRTTVCRALATSTGTPPGPVHLNVPVAKPLEPTDTPDGVGSIPESFAASDSLGVTGRDGPFVATSQGQLRLSDRELARVASEIDDADRGLIVAGPSNRPTPAREALATLAGATGFPVLADPLSGVRFGDHVSDVTVCGGYDSYLDAAGDWPDPDAVIRFGASPTSKTLRRYLRDADARQFVVDPAGAWREAAFTATDLVTADPTGFAGGLAARVAADDGTETDWTKRFARAERSYWDLVGPELDGTLFEGSVAGRVVEALPDPATLYVSNSMPVRDVDRFGRPRTADLSILGNRGASGIDGITSSALGAASGTDDPLVLLLGDLAYYHDMNGLLAVARCAVDATVVLVNNDGGGIFHKLPIESFDPPFTDQFKTPHGLDFESTGDLYDVGFERVADGDALVDAVSSSVGSAGTQVIEVTTDAAESHRHRERLHERVCEAF
ncbi:2-succinyl-5-enolpyruvyl-6-hydroxy-3-cyclohexene-1-carboxylate synthase [Halomicrobium zhouii]|uniref:2-succinyl-5-enolpyruvyl-6-hydroxy-3-cyclohexene-1-carboxylate synthase n=1 Tax=Halomicrobium zhouii TaxID=767519 RepID=A0A1I6LVF8_9EURY|nr:2-succinyl-5-enolpyruvyl-6-hydroxy-3-cyclohexene-1-carboxylic-acid synthase [Halomicrobium zhouii]SFS07409.1 2-succinyl-5-enolpyruvyl-6-hydroxy-3-cyclohexene-1-carboxylate synthase [Halomicrobium zhouii]